MAKIIKTPKDFLPCLTESKYLQSGGDFKCVFKLGSKIKKLINIYKISYTVFIF